MATKKLFLEMKRQWRALEGRLDPKCEIEAVTESGQDPRFLLKTERICSSSLKPQSSAIAPLVRVPSLPPLVHAATTLFAERLCPVSPRRAPPCDGRKNDLSMMATRLVLSSDFRSRGNAQSSRHFHQRSNGVCFHLVHHLTAVRFNSDLADAELATNLLVQQAGNY